MSDGNDLYAWKSPSGPYKAGSYDDYVEDKVGVWGMGLGGLIFLLVIALFLFPLVILFLVYKALPTGGRRILSAVLSGAMGVFLLALPYWLSAGAALGLKVVQNEDGHHPFANASNEAIALWFVGLTALGVAFLVWAWCLLRQAGPQLSPASWARYVAVSGAIAVVPLLIIMGAGENWRAADAAEDAGVPMDYFELEEGDCVANRSDGTSTYPEVSVIPCHEEALRVNKVFGAPGGQAFPGNDLLEGQVYLNCPPENFGWYFPNRILWEGYGVTTVVCLTIDYYNE